MGERSKIEHHIPMSLLLKGKHPKDLTAVLADMTPYGQGTALSTMGASKQPKALTVVLTDMASYRSRDGAVHNGRF